MGSLSDGYKVAHRPINGSLGGLVAIAAGCDAVGAHGALVIGLSAGVLVVLSERFIKRVLKLDDVVGAVSVHGVCGVWGTVLLAFFALPDNLVAASAWEQALVQLEGVGITFVWAFGVSLVFFKLLDMTLGIRVPAQAEITGLNVTEHGASLGSGALQESLIEMTKGQVNQSRRFDETSGDEAAELATLLNPFIAQVHSMVLGIRDHAEQMQKSSAGLERLSSQFRREAQGTSSLSVEVKENATAMGANARDNRETATQILKEVTLITHSADGMSEEVALVTEAISGLMTRNHGAVESITTAVNSEREVTDDISSRMERASKSASTVARSIQHVQGQAAVVLERTKENEAKLGESIEAALSLQNRAESSAEDSEKLTKEAESVAGLSNALSGSMQGFILESEETQQDHDWEEQEQKYADNASADTSSDEVPIRKATGP